MGLSVTERRFINDTGSSEEIYLSITKFRRDVNLLAHQRSKLTRKYPNKWVAFYDGEVISVADTLDCVLCMAAEQGLSHDKIITQFLNTQKRTMIL